MTYFILLHLYKRRFSYHTFCCVGCFPRCSKIILVAVQDSGSSHVGVALNALKRVGAADPILVDFRGSFALIGTADTNKPAWIAQDQHPRYKGPSVISRRIPLTLGNYTVT